MMKLKSKIVFYQDDLHSITLDSIESFDDDSGYCALLTIYSEPFACINQRFYFQGFKAFLKEIIRLNDNLKGSAGIGPTWDHEYIKFEMMSRGHITVSGELQVHSEFPQLLKFSFDTDQSYLGSFVKSAESALNELKKR